jgi:hypothetical protein
VIYDIHTGDDLYGRLAMLQPGDEVVVHEGTYPTPGFLEVTWAGTAAAPIVIHAAPGEHVVLQGDPSQNVINILGSYWTLQGFEIVGGSHGLRLKGVDHATIEDNVIHDLGDVGISCNFEMTCDSVQIIHNEIYDTGHAGTGEGMYLGCNDGSCALTNSLVALNYVHDMGGDQGDGIEIKTSSHDNIVRDNVIVRSKYPGITMYGFDGPGGPNIVERNVVWHALGDNGIQVDGQIIVRNNIVIDAAVSGIASKPSPYHTPHDVTIIDNTVVGAIAGACLKTNGWSTETGQVVANNALYCDGATAIDINGGAGTGAVIANNIGLGASTAPTGFTLGGTLAADLGDPATGNVYPPAGSMLLGKADGAHQATDDFNGTVRMGADVGAYERTADTNPGWIVTEGFKTPPAEPEPDGPPRGDDSGLVGGNDDSGCGCQGSDPTSLLIALTWLSGRWARRRNRRRRPR